MKQLIDDMKLLLLNAGTIAVTFTSVEMALKLILLTVSIVYTGIKIADHFKCKEETKE
jgi:hypothetical protein